MKFFNPDGSKKFAFSAKSLSSHGLREFLSEFDGIRKAGVRLLRNRKSESVSASTNTCPRCKLVNPPDAAHCDCGYDFASGKAKTNTQSKKPSSATDNDETLYRMVSPGRFAPVKKQPAKVNWLKLLLHPKTIISAGAFVFVVAGLFPPWLYTEYKTGTTRFSGERVEYSAGYHSILSPPARLDEFGGVKLDYERLLIEWACVAVATGAVWVGLTYEIRPKERE